MTWTVGLGVGMWAAAVFQDSLVPLPILTWGALAMLHVLLPLAEWQRIAPFVLLGWGVGSWNLNTTQSDTFLSDTPSPTLVRLDCRPDFTASLGRANNMACFLPRPMGHIALECPRLPNLSPALLSRQCVGRRGGVGLGLLRNWGCM